MHLSSLFKSSFISSIIDSSVFEGDEIKLSNPLEPQESSKENLPVKVEGKITDSITPENLNLAIDKLNNAIILESNRYVKILGIDQTGTWAWGEKLFYWLKKSSILSEEKIEKLEILLKNNYLEEFSQAIPRFLDFGKNFQDYLILNENVYLSESTFDFYIYQAGNIIEEFKLDKNNFIYLPDLENSANTDELTKIKYIYMMSISDLYDSENKWKLKIEEQNKNLLSNSDKNLKNCENIWKLDYYRRWYYYWFIETDIKSFLSLNILRKLNIPITDITPEKLMYSNYLANFEYSLEYVILIKAKIWYEHVTGIKHSDLPYSLLKEYEDIFNKFWIRQIIASTRPMVFNAGVDYYVPNMYDHEIVYLELLENILFTQSKILESHWTINTLYLNLFPLEVNEKFRTECCYTEIEKRIDYNSNLDQFNTGIGINNVYYYNKDMERFDNNKNIFIDEYNYIFYLFKQEIVEEYKDVYTLRRAYKLKMLHESTPLSCKDLNSVYEYINSVYGTKIPLDKEFVTKLKKE
jgi:hypothetical protein